MTARTRAVENAATKFSVFSFQGMAECLERGLRSIGWNSARYFELDGICFFVKGFELAKRNFQPRVRKGRFATALLTPASFGQSLYDFVVLVTP